MSKILCIPDSHLKPGMFNRAEAILESGQASSAVVLGDLFDDFGEELNFGLYKRMSDRCIEFHKKFPTTLWCMGNHDLGYYSPRYGRKETGHSRAVEDMMGEALVEFAKAGIDQKVVWLVDNVLFSHAGVTLRYMKSLFGVPSPVGYTIDAVVNEINQSTPAQLWEEYSPIWARPQEEQQISKLDRVALWRSNELLQVVGHTPMRKVTQEGPLLSTDVFSTYNNGAPYGEERFIIVDTVTKEWRYADEEALFVENNTRKRRLDGSYANND